MPPLTKGEYEKLKENLKANGCRDPLIVWKKTILDGHRRYKICEELKLPFETVEYEFADRTEAKIWMIKNQRSRRNLDESQRAMLAVRLEALYAEDAKNRQGTRTDLGKKFDKSEAGHSAKKAADDMGVSYQTVCYAKNVITKGIPDLAKLVESGKVAVSAASKAVSLAAECQQTIVEKVEERVKKGKHANIAAIIREITPKKSENDAEERFGKTKKNLATCLKLLEGIEITKSQENFAEMRSLLEKLMTRLNEIGSKNPDPSSQDVVLTPDSPQTEIKEGQEKTNSGIVESIEDELAIESQNENQTEI
jgi:hypothetical protein